MSLSWAFLAVFIHSAIQEAFSESGYYTLVSPRWIRPNSEYHVAVTLMQLSEPTFVSVEVVGKQDSGGFFRTSGSVSVEPFNTRIIPLKIGDIGPGIYNLTVRGEGGLNIYNSTLLDFVHKSYSVFIQTDKAIYKPGDRVQFRTVALSPHLRPSLTGSLDIHITDGAGNRVKQWTKVQPSRGVFSAELELSSETVLGEWTISVKIFDQVFNKQFTVAEYVLPKFQVSIDLPQHATFKDSRVAATIRAKYTYGKPVVGEATVTAYPAFVSDVIQPIFEQPVRKVVNINGKAIVEFDIVKELKLTNEYERTIQFEVTVKEALTGRQQNNSAQVQLHKHKYTLELFKSSENFKPGLKYTAFIKLAHHDGTPVIDRTNPVKVYSGYTYDSNNLTETQHMLSTNGIVELTYYPPVNSTVLSISAEYLDVKEWFSTVTGAVSPSNSYIQALLITEHPKVNDEVEIEVNSTRPLRYLSYEVLGRGDVIVANSLVVNGLSTIRLRFQATQAMAPTARLLVQYINEEATTEGGGGEVVADTLNIELDGLLQNFVDLDISPEETEPGNTVEIKYAAKPMSQIGLLGIDQSVLLLKTGNDITKEDVLKELNSYEGGALPSPGLMRGGGLPFYWSAGVLTAQEAFDNAGAIIMTNGYVHQHNPWRHASGPRLETYQAAAAAKKVVKPDIGPPVVFRPVTRPPLAGPYAFSRIPRPVWNRPRVHLQQVIQSPWLFINVSSGSDGRGSLKKSVPDTITSWVISAFSVDPVFGLGLLDIPRKVKVFRPFFVSLNLPYSVLRGETVAIPIVVFNYLDKAVQADVVLDNSGQFEFADYSNSLSEQPKLELYRKKRLTIAPNSGSSTSFLITPTELGHISIKVTAKSSLAGDAVERKLLVKPEGETQYRNKAFFIDLRSKNTFEKNVTLEIPVNIVPGSESIQVSAVGDILGPSIPNLEHLIQMPFGCGEQNMLNFVPNIVVLNYLKNSNQLTPAIESKAKRFLEAGYQRELTYKHNDGSFSAFGNSDPNGSTWLTAFVAKSFYQAMPYINVEDSVIAGALDWLASKQEPNGNFPEVGTVSHTDMQGGGGKGLALTAYVLTSLLENKRYTTQYRNVVNKATDYIVRNLEGLDDTYALAISSYALHLAQHPLKDMAFSRLEMKANTTNEMKWWSKRLNVTGSSSNKNPYETLPNCVDVEMSAYVLLTYLQRGLVQDAIPIMKWLVSQQNEQGGFASTQDTVVALGALADLAASLISPSLDITAKVSYSKGISHEIRINSANSMILQKVEIPKNIRKMNLTAVGRGFAILQVAYRYNVNVTGPWPLFDLDPQVDKNSDQNHLQLSICSRFTGGNESNMAVMEIALPSGYTVDSDALPSLQLSHNVKRIETKDGDTSVILYFDQLTRNEICPTVSAFRTHKVAHQRPVPVILYDYYDQTRKARTFYEARTATLEDICEGEDCKLLAGKVSLQSGESTGAASNLASLSTLIRLVFPIYIYFIFV